MNAARVVLHVGLPKTGTSFLQAMMRSNAAALAAREVQLPSAQGERLFAAVLHLTERAEGWGRSDRVGQRAWAEVVEEARGRRGTTVISSETLCVAVPEQVDRILGDLDGVEVEVVVSVRDAARQLPAEWQEGVKHGRRLSFEDFLATVLHTPEPASDRARVHDRFWRAQDPAGVLRRWSAELGPGRVHVVTNPPAGAPRDLLWSRFASVLGVGEVPVELPETPANASLGYPQTEVLRRINRRVPRKGNERAYGDVVKRLYAGTVLRGQGGEPVRLPDSHLTRVEELAQGWIEEIERRGHPVAGDLEDLRPRSSAEQTPDASPTALLRCSLDATADLLDEIDRLRREVADLRGRPDGHR